MFVVSHDLIITAHVADWQLRAMQGDVIQIVRQSARGTGTAHPLKALFECLSHRLGLGLTGQFGERGRQFLRAPITNVERQGSPRVDFKLHSATPASRGADRSRRGQSVVGRLLTEVCIGA